MAAADHLRARYTMMAATTMMKRAMKVADPMCYSRTLAAPKPPTLHGLLERWLERTYRAYCARAALSRANRRRRSPKVSAPSRVKRSRDQSTCLGNSTVLQAQRNQHAALTEATCAPTHHGLFQRWLEDAPNQPTVRAESPAQKIPADLTILRHQPQPHTRQTQR